MAEEKPFEATQGRLDRARRDGDSPRSAEITTAVSLACAAVGASLALPLVAAAAQRCLLVAAGQEQIVLGSYAVLACGSLVPMLGGIIGSVTATLVQARGMSFRWPAFKLEKLDPIAGCKRMFSRDALVFAAKACITALLAILAVSPFVTGVLVSNGMTSALVPLALHAVASILATVAAAGMFFGAFDFFLEQAKWRRRLRMTFEEIKRDLKQSEGDPLVRQRRKQAHRGLVRGSLSRLDEAAFVVTNPEHIAIALEYRPPQIEVPRVLIRAVDAGAKLVKQRAREMGIPLVENVPLARALLASTEVGAYIPRDTYVVVAQIVAALIGRQELL